MVFEYRICLLMISIFFLPCFFSKAKIMKRFAIECICRLFSCSLFSWPLSFVNQIFSSCCLFTVRMVSNCVGSSLLNEWVWINVQNEIWRIKKKWKYFDNTFRGLCPHEQNKQKTNEDNMCESMVKWRARRVHSAHTHRHTSQQETKN